MAPSVTPTGILGAAMAAIAGALSECVTWQTLCDAEDDTDALNFVYYQAVNSRSDAMTFPYAILYRDSLKIQRNAIGQNRTIFLELGTVIPEEYAGEENDGEALQWFENSVGSIISELLPILSIRTQWVDAEIHPCMRVPREEGFRADYDEVSCIIALSVGMM